MTAVTNAAVRVDGSGGLRPPLSELEREDRAQRVRILRTMELLP
jgi:hypothetical protein